MENCKVLTLLEEEKLKQQESKGLVSVFHQTKLEKDAGKNWDKFYKRNETRFFKDRHWTTREFEELIGSPNQKSLFEVGCGVGNFFYPLLEEGLKLSIHACDISTRAVDFVKSHKLYSPSLINAFVCDITKDDLQKNIPEKSVDIVSLVFVVSAILPKDFSFVFQNIYKVMRPGGIILFRDYAVNDMAMIRFGPGSKMADRLYVRQDGTRAYYFKLEELADLVKKEGFEILQNDYINRRTINRKEGLDCDRIFVQAKFQKPY